MIRWGLRLIGLILLAAGFAALIIDGTRSIAGGSLAFTSFGGTLRWAMPAKLEALELQIQHINPHLWDPVAVSILGLPTWSVAGFIGFLLLALAARKPRQIGYSSRD